MGKKLRTREAAEWLGVAPETIRYWRQIDRGPRFIKLSERLFLYDEDDLKKHCADRRVEPSVRDLVEKTYANLR